MRGYLRLSRVESASGKVGLCRPIVFLSTADSKPGTGVTGRFSK